MTYRYGYATDGLSPILDSLRARREDALTRIRRYQRRDDQVMVSINTGRYLEVTSTLADFYRAEHPYSRVTRP